MAGAAGVLVERLLTTLHVRRARRRGVDVTSAGGGIALPLGHFCVSLRRKFWQALQEGHHIPYLAIRQTELPSRHSGEADAVAGDPVQLTGVEVLRRINQWTGQRLHAFAHVALRHARRTVALRALVVEAGRTALDHGLVLQRRRHDVARMLANRAVHDELQHREHRLQVLARSADVVQTGPYETRGADHAKGGECCNRGENRAGFAHGGQPIVDAHCVGALCGLPLFIPLLMAVLLSGCSGKPPSLHAQQDPQQAARGQTLLAQYQCGSCHTIPGVAASRGTVGPTLQAFSRRSYIAGNVPNQPAALAQWIVDPKTLIPATTMPSMGASTDDARAMAAYLHSLQ